MTMRKVTKEDAFGNPITITYFDDGEECSRQWYSVCPHCGGRMSCFRLSDGTGGGDTCVEKDCGYQNLW